MISYEKAVLLGIIQGLTEFIPVSSTAHLRVIPALLSIVNPDFRDPGAAYSAVIQIGTLVSLIIFFFKDLVNFTTASIKGVFSKKPFENSDSRMLWLMALATIPISVLGLLFSKLIKGELRSLYVISFSLIVFGLVLFLIDRRATLKKALEELNWQDALLIGFAQSVALIPGASRSGMTLLMGLLLGYRREASMRISFLISIPAVALSGLYELYSERHELAEAGFVGLAIATVVSAVVGYASIAFLLRYLKTHSTSVFVAYRVAVGLVIISLLAAGILHPL